MKEPYDSTRSAQRTRAAKVLDLIHVSGYIRQDDSGEFDLMRCEAEQIMQAHFDEKAAKK
jgi:hypothetical protein